LTYAVAAVLYIARAGRGPAPGDWGDFVAAASCLGVAHPTGYAVYLQLLALPLRALPGAWAAAVADVANALLVAVAPASVAGALASFLRGEGGWGKAFAVAAGAAFATLPALWLQATSVEVYGAGLAIYAGVLALLLAADERGDNRYAMAAVFLAGLAAGVHLTSFTYAAAALVCWAVWKRRTIRFSPLAAVAAALALSAALYIPLRCAAGTALPWSGITDLPALFRHAVGRQFSYNFRWPTALLASYRGRELATAAWENLGPLIVLTPFGWWALARRAPALAAALGVTLLLNSFYLLIYDIPDLAAYQLPWLAVIALGSLLAAAEVFSRTRATLARAALTFALATAAVVTAVGAWPRLERYPAFVAYYNRKLLEPIGYRGMFVAGTTTSNFLCWVQRYTAGRRPDVELYNLNDERFDFEPLAARVWRTAGARPVCADYLFVSMTYLHQTLYAQAVNAGFLVGIRSAPTAPPATEPPDGEVLAAVAKFLKESNRATAGAGPARELAAATYTNHAQFYRERGDAAREKHFFEEGAALAPELAASHVNLGAYYAGHGELEKARRQFYAALARRDQAHQFYAAYGQLALLAAAEGDLDGALTYARRAVALKPHDGRTHRLLAQIYLARGERELGRRELERTLARGYADPDTVLMLAALYEEEGESDRAFELLRKNAHRYDDARVMDAYAGALAARGRYAEARREWERALRLAPASPEIRDHLARLAAAGY
jgi:Tfp pilus assembly protein PilF/stage V sporulation protein SpoVS